MPIGFGKRSREAVPSSEDDYYGADYANYHAPPAAAFQHNHTAGGAEYQDDDGCMCRRRLQLPWISGRAIRRSDHHDGPFQ